MKMGTKRGMKKLTSYLLAMILIFSSVPVGATGDPELETVPEAPLSILSILGDATGQQIAKITVTTDKGYSDTFTTLPISIPDLSVGTSVEVIVEASEGYRILQSTFRTIITGSNDMIEINASNFETIEVVDDTTTGDPTDGEQPPDDGTIPPDDGTQPPDDGTTPSNDGIQPPDEGTQPPPGEEPEEKILGKPINEDLLIIPMGIGTPGVYTSDTNSIVVPTELTGAAINKHTVPVIVWANGGTVYAAVKSTHELSYMILGGIKSTTFDEYNPRVNIHVDGTEYEPDGLQGNTKDSHWTVFKFPLSELAVPTDGELAFFVKGKGGGHDVGGSMLVKVPKIDITGEKIWVGGESRPTIVLELRRYLVGGDASSAELVANSKVTLDGSETTPWSHTWEDMQEYSSYGQKYVYYVDEETVPVGYEKSIDEVGGRTVTNTYIALPALTLTKVANKETYSAVGDVITYTYEVTNSGNVALDGPFVISDDNLDAGQTVQVEGPLAAGASGTATGTRTVTQEDLDAGSIVNKATATFEDTTSNEATETVTTNALPGLTLTKVANKETYSAVGDVITYTYEVTNSGNVALDGPFLISDDKIANVPDVAGPLAPGASGTVTATHTVTQADLDAGSIVNKATATFGNTTSNEATETVTTNALPGLTLTKVANKETYSAVGDVITYTYEVTNSGNVALDGPFVISDDNLDEGQVVQVAGPLAPGASGTATGIRTVTQKDLDDGSITNIATATNGNTTSEPDTVTVTAVKSPALTIDKSVNVETYSMVREIITYSYKVTNSGNVTLVGPFTIIDDKLEVDTSETPATLAPGESFTVTESYAITQKDLDDGSITNIATATNGNTTSEPDTVTVTAVKSPALTIDKSVNVETYSMVREIITYSYKVTNSGNVTLVGPFTIIDDKLEVDTSETPATLAPGESFTVTESYAITQKDLDDGSITNIATATSGDTTSEPDTVTVTAVKSPALTIDKSVNVETYSMVREIITYSYKVTNSGNVTLAGPFTINDDKLEVDTSEAPATLAPGESFTVTESYAITQKDLDDGSITNIATATSGDTTSEPDTVTVTAVKSPALTIDKSVNVETYSMVREIITYSYKVTNSGNVTLAGPFLISDDNLDEDQIVQVAGPLAPGASGTATGIRTVTQKDLDAGSITNIATASFEDTTSNEATVTVNATQTTDITATKIWRNSTGHNISIQLQLYKDGVAFGAPVTIVNTSTYTWRNLDKYRADGTLIRYRVDEINVPSRYTKHVQDDGFTIVNTYIGDDRYIPVPWIFDTGGGGLLLNDYDHIAYVQGYPGGSFRAENSITRAEATMIFARLMVESMNINTVYTNPYNDVPLGKWYSNAIGFLTGKGIIEGYPDGSFRPDEPITRAEYAKLASGFDSLSSGSSSFPDVHASHWAKRFIDSAYTKGWIQGYPDGTFKPESHIRRSEVVTIVNRMLNRQADRSFIRNNPLLIKHYNDLLETHWAYYDIMEASHTHDYTRPTPKSETWIRIKPNR